MIAPQCEPASELRIAENWPSKTTQQDLTHFLAAYLDDERPNRVSSE